MQPAHLVSRSSLAFLWRSPARAAYAGVFVVVAALELYGTAIGTWRWAEELPGLGIPDGNPPSGVASGYVWFDVMALLLVPRLLALVEPDLAVEAPSRARHRPGLNRARHTAERAAKKSPRPPSEDVSCGPSRSSWDSP